MFARPPARARPLTHTHTHTLTHVRTHARTHTHTHTHIHTHSLSHRSENCQIIKTAWKLLSHWIWLQGLLLKITIWRWKIDAWIPLVSAKSKGNSCWQPSSEVIWPLQSCTHVRSRLCSVTLPSTINDSKIVAHLNRDPTLCQKSSFTLPLPRPHRILDTDCMKRVVQDIQGLSIHNTRRA